MVILDRGLERMVGIIAPVRNELVDADRINHGARKNMGANFAALLQNHDRQLGIDLFEPDRR